MKVVLIVIATLLVVLVTTSAIPIFAQSPDQEAKDLPLLPVEIGRVKRGGFGNHEYFGRWYKNYFCC